MDLAGGQYEETGTIVVNYIEVALRNVELRGVRDGRSAPPTGDEILATRLDMNTLATGAYSTGVPDTRSSWTVPKRG